MATSTTTPSVEVKRTRGSSRIQAARVVIADAATTAASLAADATTRVPEAAATTRAAFDDANRRIQASSDEMLRLGTAISFGFATGLLVGGANRLLVGAAFVPVAMVGLTLLDRSTGPRGMQAR